MFLPLKIHQNVFVAPDPARGVYNAPPAAGEWNIDAIPHCLGVSVLGAWTHCPCTKY